VDRRKRQGQENLSLQPQHIELLDAVSAASRALALLPGSEKGEGVFEFGILKNYLMTGILLFHLRLRAHKTNLMAQNSGQLA
jgi:hypothetical protein